MSAVQLIVALILLAVGGALLFRWLQQRHGDEWKDGVATTEGSRHATHPQSRSGAHVDSDEEGEEYDGGEGNAAGGGGVRRRGGGHAQQAGLRRRGQRGEPAAAAAAAGADIDEYDENGVKLTRLQRKKLAKEREKEERRLAQEAALADQQERSQQQSEKEAISALKVEAMKAAEEEALQQLRDDKMRAENEEYAKWAGQIGVEERGELGDEARQRQARMQAYLLERAARVQARAVRSGAGAADAEDREADADGHVLVLQSAARDLKVSVEELVNTIEAMTRDGTVDGVFDDRGKYVFIAPQHFPLLAQFMRQRGRVSVQEFTRECNRVIMQA